MTFESPLGPLWLAASTDGLTVVRFDGPPAVLDPAWGPAPSSAVDALRAYFEGDLAAIDAIPVAPAGTAFQREVWAALRTIPAGTTIGYGELGERLGRTGAMRAVGAANGANPVGIVIPCHRVVAADGSLHGYAGGLDRKAWLLRHESPQRGLFG